jgi:hypothetical protein
MTHKPEDDRDLVNFLRQHRPIPPPASADLENQIMRKIAPRRRPIRWWVGSGALAAGLATAILSYRVLQPVPPSTTELASVEAFMESSWSSSISGNSDTTITPSNQEFLALIESTNE